MPQLKLDAVHDETSRIRVFVFSAADGSPLPRYTAGAHLEFDLGVAGQRAYSLIDWPDTTPDYTIAVQREEAGEGGSQAMHALKVGDIVSASTPANDFELQDGSGRVLLLAGGMGITPMVSMATALNAAGRAFELHYTGRSKDVMGLTDPLSAAFGEHLTLYFDDMAPLDLKALMAAQSQDTQLYICGPKGMIGAGEQAGLRDIHVELFATPQASGDDAPFEVEIHDSGQIFTVPPGKTIIEVLEAEGVDLMYDCQRGDCGTCQTDVISGVPDHRDVVLSDDERAAGKVMQICVSRAKSPRLVLDL